MENTPLKSARQTYRNSQRNTRRIDKLNTSVSKSLLGTIKDVNEETEAPTKFSKIKMTLEKQMGSSIDKVKSLETELEMLKKDNMSP